MKKLSATKLRADIYKVLDEIIRSGIPVEIERGSESVRIVPVTRKSKLTLLKKRKTMICAPEEIVHMDWSSEWGELK